MRVGVTTWSSVMLERDGSGQVLETEYVFSCGGAGAGCAAIRQGWIRHLVNYWVHGKYSINVFQMNEI